MLLEVLLPFRPTGAASDRRPPTGRMLVLRSGNRESPGPTGTVEFDIELGPLAVVLSACAPGDAASRASATLKYNERRPEEFVMSLR